MKNQAIASFRRLMLMLFLGMPLSVWAVDEEAKHQYESTAKLISAKDYKAAKSLLGMILEKEPKYADALYAAGFCEEALGNEEAALVFYHRCLEEVEENSELAGKIRPRIAKLDPGTVYVLGIADQMEKHARANFGDENNRAYQTTMDAVAKLRDDSAIRAVNVKQVGGPLRLVVWNTYYSSHKDRGTKDCIVALYKGGQLVSQRELKIPWSAGKDTFERLTLPEVRFDRIRITITSWVGKGGGLSEVQLFSGAQNIAPKALISASGSYNGFPVSNLVDANTSSSESRRGYWLLQSNSAGWVDFDFSDSITFRNLQR